MICKMRLRISELNSERVLFGDALKFGELQWLRHSGSVKDSV